MEQPIVVDEDQSPIKDEDIYSEVHQRPLAEVDQRLLAAIEEDSLFTTMVSKVENLFVVSSSTIVLVKNYVLDFRFGKCFWLRLVIVFCYHVHEVSLSAIIFIGMHYYISQSPYKNIYLVTVMSGKASFLLGMVMVSP